MKELTIEEKAQRYDEALKVAKGLYAKDAPDSLHLERMFPELKERDDEKMELLEHLKSCLSTSSTTIWKKKYQRWIAWLEKQGEQKPAAWSEYDEDLLLELSQCCDLNKTQVQWLLSLKYRAQPQPQREWSEEDVLAIKRIIDTIQCAQLTRNGKPRALYTDEILDNLVNWLKSLKNRTLSQSKQEWSEEDENLFEEIKRCVGIQYPLGNPCIFKFLKSLKDRYTWKPSEEQMKALTFACIKNVGIDKSSIKALYDLKEQLKQL